MINRTFKLTTLAIATTLLTACGGGGGSSSGGSTNPPTTPPYTGKTLNGVAIDFYLAGATVQFDDCKDESGNPLTVETNAQGQFEFTTTETCKSSALTITGGVDTVTEKLFTGTLKTKKLELENNTSPVASPLTTLEAILPAQEFKNVLKNLGFSENTDVSSFNPVEKGTAQQLATVFLVQQLLTQIEDAIQDSGSTIDATKVAAEALSNVLQTTSLIKNSSQFEFDINVINSVVEKAKTQAPNINSSSITASNIAKTFNTVGLTGDASALLDLLDSNTDLLKEIQDAINPPTSQIPVPNKPEFTTLKIGNYSLLKFQQTTQNKPLVLQKAEFSDITKLNLKLALPDIRKPAIAKIGLQVNASNGKQLQLVLDSVRVYFDANGNPVEAILPAESSIKVSSNVAALKKYTSFTMIPNKDLKLTVNNSQIDLGSFSDEADKLESAFNNFYNEIANIGYTKVETTINMTNYSASKTLSIPVIANKTILGTSFKDAYNVVGYFKFNPVTTP